MLMGAIALALVAGTATAADLSGTVSYKDNGVYAQSLTVSGQNRFGVLDATVINESRDDWQSNQRFEVGNTFVAGTTRVRLAVGEYFGEDDFAYYSVTPSYALNVPYTDSFVVSARYRNAFDYSGFETYGVGTRAGWDVGSVRVSAGFATYRGDSEYNEYTLGLSKKF